MHRILGSALLIVMGLVLLVSPGAAQTRDPSYASYASSPASPASHGRTVHTKVSLTVTPRSRIAGESRKLTVQVRPNRVRRVLVQRLRGRSWTTVARARTSAAGRVAITRTAAASATTYRAVVRKLTTGSRTYSAARSAKAVSKPHAQSVSLSLPTRASPGSSVTARVVASPVRTGRTVLIQRRLAGGWATLATGHESRTGQFTHALTSGAAGSTDYRAVVKSAHGAATVTSRVATLVVTPAAPPPLTSPPADTTAPAAPTGVTATPGDGAVTVRWSPVGAGDLAGYRVLSSTSSLGGFRPTGAQPAGAQTSVTVGGLTNGTTYFFQVQALDTAGNGSTMSQQAEVVPIDVTAPAAPTNVLTDPGDTTVTVAWTAVGAADLDHYTVYLSTDPDAVGYAEAGGTPAGTTSLLVDGLDNGTTYSFIVRAVDTSGNTSAPSVVVEDIPDVP